MRSRLQRCIWMIARANGTGFTRAMVQERFGIAPRTFYRDIEELQGAGIVLDISHTRPERYTAPRHSLAKFIA